MDHGSRRVFRPRSWVVVLSLTTASVAAAALPASGHAIVKATEPAIDEVVETPPQRVLMEFNEPVEISFGAIRVFDTHGRRVDEGEAEYIEGSSDQVQVPVEANLADGTYTVAWRIVSADGHPIGEAYVFHVGTPGENPRGIVDQVLSGEGGAGPLEAGLAAVGRWFALASLLLLGGAALFLILVWGRVMAPTEVEDAFARGWARLVRLAWVIAVISTIALYVLQGALAADLPLVQAMSPDVLSEVATTRFGIVFLIRLGLLAAAAAMWPSVRRALEPRRSVGAAAAVVRPAPGLVVSGSVLVVALLATPGIAGHAGTTEPIALNVAADVLHMVAAAMWMGGLLLLFWGAFPATRGLGEPERVATLAPVVARFSDLAVVAVGALVVSGVFRGWAEVRALTALTGTTYGVVLLLKLAAFLPILVMGAINNRWLKPRIVRGIREGDPAKAHVPLRTLRRLVGIEVALGALVIAVTALLVNLPPARVEAGVEGPFRTEVALGHHHLNVMVDPNQVGENRIHLMAETESQEPAHFEEVRVLFRMPEEGIGPVPGKAEEMAPGEYVVHGHQLSVPGEWMLEIVARSGEFEEERAKVNVTVNP
ncbi:MAG TPA: copper resistance protein CopC [Actinomycetota bacterium]|nr:copper resistance protein CopC [Actinomycetota bacterium]